MIAMYITTTDASEGHFAHRKKLRRTSEDEVYISRQNPSSRQEPKDDALEDPHAKQIFDLLAWHIALEDPHAVE